MLDADPLAVITGELEHKPELPILLDLLAEAEERAGAPVLRRWVRAAGPARRPLDLLLERDFGAFEDALATLARARVRCLRRARGSRRAARSGRFSPGHAGEVVPADRAVAVDDDARGLEDHPLQRRRARGPWPTAPTASWPSAGPPCRSSSTRNRRSACATSPESMPRISPIGL